LRDVFISWAQRKISAIFEIIPDELINIIAETNADAFGARLGLLEKVFTLERNALRVVRIYLFVCHV
jgi:hypothetical protein